MSVRLANWFFLIGVATLPLVQGLGLSLDRYPIQISDFAFLLALIFWLGSVILRADAVRWDALFYFVAAYAIVLGVSTLLSVDRPLSSLKLAGELYLFAIAFLAFQLITRDEKLLRKTVLAWLLGTAAVIVFSVAGVALFYIGLTTQAANPFLSHYGSLPAGSYPRIRSVFANANMMANFLNISLPLTFAAASLGWLSLRKSRMLTVGTWISAILTLSPGLGGLFLSASLWRKRRQGARSRVILWAGIVAASIFFAATLISPDTPNTDRQTVVLGRTIEPSVRVLVWEDSIRTISENPLFGRGVGVDPAAVRYETLSGDKQFLRDAHNIALNIAGQSGVIGLSAFAAFVAFLLMRLERRAPDPMVIGLGCALVGSVLYQGLTGSFENARHVWLFLGIVGAVGSLIGVAVDVPGENDRT